uniref:Cytochrome P450 3081A1 n=1 Tax=Paracyclopina nana TaxID=565004 RepID=A0A0F7J1U7_PARNA|nr:cytochrome P450 3081A1 [Paracyclopina nana]
MWWLLLIGASLLYYLHIKNKMRYFEKIGLPHEPGTFPFGSDISWKMLAGKFSIVSLAEEVYRRFPKVKVAGYYSTFGDPVVVVNDYDIAKRILIKDFDHFVDRRPMVTNPKSNKYVVKMLTMMRGDQWKATRHAVSPFFTSGRLRAILPSVDQVNDELMDYLSNLADLQSVEIKDILLYSMVEVLSMVGCGVKPNIMKNPGENVLFQEFKKATGAAQNGTAMLKFVLLIFFPKLFYNLNIPLQDPKTMAFFADIIRKSMKERKEKKNDLIDCMLDVAKNMEQSMEEADEEAEETDLDKSAKIHTVGKMVAQFSDEELETLIISQGLLFFQAGSDTTSSSLSMILYFLSFHQDVQEKLHREIRDAIDDNSGDEHLSYATLNSLKYMEAVVKECLRHWGISFIERSCNKDYYIPEVNLTIRPGTLVQVPGGSIMMESRFFPDPEKFDPDLHFGSDVSMNPTTFFSFGQGPRSCIGVRFAWILMRATLARLLSTYKFLPGPNMKPTFEIDPKSTSGGIIGGIRVRMEKRRE